MCDLTTIRRELESALAESKRHSRRLNSAAGFAAYRVAAQRVVVVQRKLALAEGREAAIPIPCEPWDGGAPMPHVVSSGHRTFVLYMRRESAGDGTSVRVVSAGSEHAEQLVILEVLQCYAHRFGGPNDEVFHGHPLSESGFDGYGAFEVENSRWIEQEKQINSVHSGYSEARWQGRRHFLLAFHDEIFECIANGLSTSFLWAPLLMD